jgi:hypothetical protein
MIDPVFVIGFQLVTALILAGVTFLMTFWWLPARSVRRLCVVAPIVAIVSFYTVATLNIGYNPGYLDETVAMRVVIPLGAALLATLFGAWLTVRTSRQNP